MLILGGRYGSIEEKSGKSYTQLEYEYALSKNIPVFSVVLNDEFITKKIISLGLRNATEIQNPEKYKDFKKLVMTKIIREVEDCKEIKITVLTTLNEFLSSYDLLGWIRGEPEHDYESLLKEINELSKENRSLLKENKSLSEINFINNRDNIGDFTYTEIKDGLSKQNFTIPISETDETIEIDALSFYIVNYDKLCTGITNQVGVSKTISYIFYHCTPHFMTYGLMERVKYPNSEAFKIHLSKQGLKFYSLLKLNNDIKLSKIENDLMFW
jgi:hypothetical protein